MTRSWWAAVVAGALALVVAAGVVAVAGYEAMQRRQCLELGHVYSPADPNGRLSQCWVTPR